MIDPYYQDDMVTIYHGSFPDIMPLLPEGSVDAVITDPPYPSEYKHLWQPLAEQSARILPRGGSLLSLVPHYLMPYVLSKVRKHLKYRWMMAMWQSEGAHARMAMGIEVSWKPLVWWVKDAWPIGRGFVKDGFVSEQPPTKQTKLHKWEQTASWADYCLKVVPNGGTVLDPMMGSGTLLKAATQKGYKSIGIDIDEESCKIAVHKLNSN